VLSRRLKSESGFTLPELIVTLTITMILSLATFSLIEVVMRRTGETTARIDAVQRGRTAMDIVTRDLRSQVCAWATNTAVAMPMARSLESASPTSVGVFVDFTNEAQVAGVSPAPSLRTITLTAAGNLTENVRRGTWAPAAPNRTVLEATGTTRTLTGGIAAPAADGIVFRFYQFNNANPPQPIIALPTNRALTPAELATVAKIRVSYRAIPQRGVAAGTRGTANFQNEIYIRSADPNQIDLDNPIPPVPTCPTF
jgi:prepilin-type N-terminal cleavage/methylation domain-containing protein